MIDRDRTRVVTCDVSSRETSEFFNLRILLLTMTAFDLTYPSFFLIASKQLGQFYKVFLAWAVVGIERDESLGVQCRR